MFLARDKHHLADLSHLIRHEAPYLFQKYVQESHGRDVRVIVVGGRVIGTMLRCSTDGRMQSNCSLGEYSVRLSHTCSLSSLKATVAIGCLWQLMSFHIGELWTSFLVQVNKGGLLYFFLFAYVTIYR